MNSLMKKNARGKTKADPLGGIVGIESNSLFLKKTKKTKKEKPTNPDDGFNMMITNVANSNPFGKNTNSSLRGDGKLVKNITIDFENDTQQVQISKLFERMRIMQNEFEEYKIYAESNFARTKDLEKELQEMEDRFIKRSDD